jgi:hypothetical protein
VQAELPEAWTEVYHKAVSRLPFACGDYGNSSLSYPRKQSLQPSRALNVAAVCELQSASISGSASIGKLCQRLVGRVVLAFAS